MSGVEAELIIFIMGREKTHTDTTVQVYETVSRMRYCTYWRFFLYKRTNA